MENVTLTFTKDEAAFLASSLLNSTLQGVQAFTLVKLYGQIKEALEAPAPAPVEAAEAEAPEK